MSSHTPLPATTAPVAVAVDENNVVDDSVNINLPNRWFFEKDKLEATPSRKCGIDPDKELTYRQQSANFIQDIGQRLQVNQLCINTAIVYMHRFYMFHSFSHFHRNAVSTASIFLAAKVEEQPRKLEHVIKVAHYCLHRETQPQIDVKSEQYAEQSSELVMNENVLLQTLGFDVAIDHPHTHVVKCCQLVRASKDLAQTSYFMATNSLHLTTMCLQYKPTVVACVCIHLACKWSNWEIPRSKEGKDWFWYVDDTVTTEQLESMTTEFLTIFNKSPSRLKKKMMSLNQVSGGANLSLSSFPTHMSIDPTSPGAPNFPKSRSPSPAGSTKRVNPMKPSGSQQFIAGKSSKPHGMPPSAAPHGMKHHGPPGSSLNNKHVHPSATKPPYHQHQHGFPIHSAKDSHQQLQQTTQSKDGIVHGKHPNAPPHNHSHGAPPYPHNSGRQNAQSHHSQSHSGQKPLPPGSHPSNLGYSSKVPPPHPSKVPHTMGMAKPSAPGSSSNKNPTSSSGSYPPPAKKIYPEGYVSKEDILNRRSNSGQPHPPQSRPRPPDKPDVRHHPSSGPGGQLPNSIHPTHLADHSSRTWIDHTSAFGTEPSSSGRNDNVNPALVGANKTLSNEYYQSQRHRPDNLGEKRASSSTNNNGGIPNILTSSAVVDRNDNINAKTETMDDQFNQIASKVNANSYYPSTLNNTSVSMNIDISGNVPLSKSKQLPGGGPMMSSLADVAGFIKKEEDLNLISVATITPIPDVNKASNKRRHEGPGDMRNSSTLKRARSDGHATLTSSGMQIFPTYTANTDDLTDSKKPIPSKTSPSHAMTRENRRSNNLSAFTKGLTNRNDSTVVDGGSGVFGNDLQCDATGKLDISSALSMELQPPELLAPFGESHHQPLMAKSRGSSLFSPTSDAPSSGLINSIKVEPASSVKAASGAGSLKPVPNNNASYFSMNSGVSLNNNSAHNGAAVSVTNNYADASLAPDGTSSASVVPAALVTNEPSGSDHHKKSKKSKKEKHKHKDKHKDKEERKHKKDKHREKDRDKHRSRDKRKSVDSVVVESVIENKPTACKLKISLGAGGGTSSAVEKHPKEKESKSKHSSSSKRTSDELVEDTGSSSRSKMSSSSMKTSAPGTLKVKIVKERVKSTDEDHHPGKRNLPSRGEQHSQGQSTPCCPGFGPCTNPNCNQGQAPIRVKIPKEKIIAASASSRPPKESKEPKKSKKEKEPKVKERTVLPTPIVNSKSAVGRGNSSTTSNHGHKNGVEKVSRKRESASSL